MWYSIIGFANQNVGEGWLFDPKHWILLDLPCGEAQVTGLMKGILAQVPESVNASQLARDCERDLNWLMQSGDTVHESELTSRLSQLMRKAEPDKYGDF